VINKETLNSIDRTRPVVFYGAGEKAPVFAELLDSYNIFPACWVDRDASKRHKKFCGNLVLSLKEAVDKYPGCYIYMTISEEKWEDISNEIIKSKLISKEQILNFIIHVKYKSCRFLECEISTYNDRIAPCCAPVGRKPFIQVDFSDYNATIDRFFDMREKVINEINKGSADFGCSGCRHLVEQYWPERDKLSCLHVVDQGVCQFDCVYCGRQSKGGKLSDKPTLDFSRFIQLLRSQDALASNFFVDFSNDEITVNPKCDEILDAFSEFPITLYTNAGVFNEKIVSALSKPGSKMIVSVDAGTKETFERVKGCDVFDEVCENVRKYARSGISITLKYLIVPSINDNFSDAKGFIELCKEINASQILVSRDWLSADKGVDLPDSAIDVAKFLLSHYNFKAKIWNIFTDNDLVNIFGTNPVNYEEIFTYEHQLIKAMKKWLVDFNNCKIAIYGVGVQTKAIIDNFPELNIVCLLDFKQQGKMIWGKDVVPIEDAIAKGIDTIIIVALPANVPVIYKRISNYCIEHSIEAYGMNGHRLDYGRKPVDEVLNEFYANPYNRPIIDDFRLQPPVLNVQEGKFVIESNYEIGRAFIAPIAYKFLHWIKKQAQDKKLGFLLFAARDSWVLMEMLDILPNFKSVLPPYAYFQVSRAATLIAGLTNTDEIAHSFKMTFDGPMERLLTVRYRLSPEEIMIRGNESDKEYILRHADLILHHAKTERDNYRKYIKTLGIPDNARVGFVDFLSVGTSIWGLERIMNQSLIGLFFAKRHNEEFSYMDITGMFDTECLHVSRDYIEENHYFLETIFTSFDSTLMSFDYNGNPIFSKDDRNPERLDALREVQKGILDYSMHVKENDLDFEKVDLQLLDYIVHLLSDSYSIVKTDYFRNEVLLDEFTNSSFALVES